MPQVLLNDGYLVQSGCKRHQEMHIPFRPGRQVPNQSVPISSYCNPGRFRLRNELRRRREGQIDDLDIGIEETLVLAVGFGGKVSAERSTWVRYTYLKHEAEPRVQ